MGRRRRYVIATSSRPPRPVDHFFARRGQYGRTTYNPEGYHFGSDVRAAVGAVVRALVAGVVVFSGTYGDLGQVVMVRDRFGRVWGYAHLQRRGRPRVGDRVRCGGAVGRVGLTGRTTGPHVHLFGLERELVGGRWGSAPYFNPYPELVAAWNHDYGREKGLGAGR